MGPLDFIDRELEALDAAGLRRRLHSLDGPQAPRIRLGGREVVAFCSNDYLGLANHPALTAAAVAGMERAGHGAGASRLIAGNLAPHRELEATLARFHATAAALLFPSGYQANAGTIAALYGADDLVCSDELNHASIIDGCRLSRAQVRVYRHGDVAHLEELLRSPARRRLVVSDAIFSMDGDRAPVVELRGAADRAGAALMVDEAHAAGVIGPQGQGLCAELGVVPDILVGTLGKSFGSAGAYVAGSRPLVDLLLNRARSFVFTTAPTIAPTTAARAAVELAAGGEGEDRRATLRRHSQRFAAGLRALGVPADATVGRAIYPLVIGDNRRTMDASVALLELGVFVQGVRPPTVPRGTSRLRFALSAAHEEADIALCLDALAATRSIWLPTP